MVARIALIFGVLLVAGCGSTVTKTKVVPVKPCGTPERMARCAVDMANASLVTEGFKPGVRAHCSRTSGGFSCVMRLPDDVGKQSCLRASIRVLPETGIPFLTDDVVAKMSTCDRLFGKA